jgi:uncharacterized protein involved in type VI secretion and phage assembly
VRDYALVRQYLGKYRGVVAKNRDPLQKGRVQVRVPAVLGESTLSWAMPSLPYAGPEGVGLFTVPPEKANVWVEFEAGDPNRPIWSGCFWGEGEKVPTRQGTAEQKVLKTKAGTIKIDDSAEELIIETSRGAKIVMDSQGIEISNGKGASVKLSSNMVSINGSALEVQ